MTTSCAYFSKRHSIGVLVVAILSFLAAAEPPRAAEQQRDRPVLAGRVGTDDFSIAKIVNAWEQREQRLRSAIFEWTERRVQMKSTLAKDESLSEPPEPQYDVEARLSIKQG